VGAQRSRRGGLIVLLIAIVVVGIVATSVTVARADPSPGEKSVRVVQWPEAIAPIAHRVELIRGLRFRHSVPVRHVHVQRGTTVPVDARTRATFETALQPLVALGLVSGDNDVASLVSTMYESPAGVYSPESKVIRIFVPTGAAFGHAVLAHELTHALEDQHFRQGDRPTPRTASQAIADRAVVEGSASLVERWYVHEQWKAPFQREAPSGAVDLGTSTPLRQWEWFAALGTAPYALGLEYVDATLARGDLPWGRIVAYPPSSDVVVVDPLVSPGSLWQATSPIPSALVREPAALEVFLVLASRVDPADALEAVVHSAGAMLTTYERDGRPCADLTLLTRTPDDPAVNATLDEWIASAGAANASRSSVANFGSRVLEPARTPTGAPTVLLVKVGAPVLTSCRGVSAAPFGSFVVPLAQLVGRNAAIARALRHGLDDTTTACVAQAVFTDPQVRDDLRRALGSQPTISANHPRRVYRRAVAGCASNL